MNDFQAIAERINLLEYISKRWQTKSIGTSKYRVNPCPICGHNDCFTIFEKSQNYHCYSCGSHGDIFEITVKTKEADTRYDALVKFAREINYDLHKTAKKTYEDDHRIQEIFNMAAEFYHQQLTGFPREHLINKRKRNDEFIGKMKYGFANGQSIYEFLVKQGFSKTLILKSGLVRQDDNGVRDLFGKNLFIYPVSYRERISDFFCKDYLQEDKKKRRDYQLPKENKLNNILFYGQEALYSKEFIIVEGPEDRNTIIQNYDIPALAILGQISKEQLDYLGEHVQEGSIIYLAFDKDHAGRRYERAIIDKLTGIAILKKLIWEGDADIDEYLNQQIDPAIEIENLLRTAQDMIEHEINNIHITNDMDPRTADRIIQPICKYIAQEKGEITRVNFIEKLATRLAAKEDGSMRQRDKDKFLPAIKRAVNEYLGIKTAVGDQQEATPDQGVFTRNNRYYYVTEKGIQKISTFIMKILRYISEEEEMFYEVQLVNDKGSHSHHFLLSSKERVNYRAFKEACGRQGSYYYMGDDNHLAEIWQKEEERAGELPITCYFKKYGWIPQTKFWLFKNCIIQGDQAYRVEENDIISIDGIGYKSKDVNVYSNDDPIINIDFKITDSYIQDIIIKYWTLWDHREGDTVVNTNEASPYFSFKGFLALGYMAAMAYRPEWSKHDRLFPNLFSYGPVRTGKSHAIRLLMNMMGWHNDGNMWSASSVVGMTYALESLSCLPLWMEEYENMNTKNPNQERKIELIRGAYNMSSPIKGSLNKNIVAHEVNTSFIITGQDYFTDKAAQTRTIELRKEKPTPEGTAAYYDLKAEADSGRLSAIFAWLLRNKTKESIKEMINNFKQVKKFISDTMKGREKDVDERALINYSMIIASFAHFNFHRYDQEFIEWITTHIMGAQEKQLEADILYQFFSDIEILYQGDEMKTVIDIESGYLYFHYDKIFNDWKINSNRLFQRENISKSILRDYMKHAPEKYYHDNKRHYFDTIDKYGNYAQKRRCQAICIEVEKLPPELKEIVEDWIQ